MYENTKEISETLHWTPNQVKYCIKKLKDEKKIKREGSNRDGYWLIL